jgi:hypothetical protein
MNAGTVMSYAPIHRYLREIEEEASTRLDDVTRLNQSIKEPAGRLT